MHQDEIYGMDEHLSSTNILLTDVNCSGYPYLILARNDYNLEKTNLAYDHLAELVLQYGISGAWTKGKSHFFDIHPVFSNAEPVPGLLGFHLSLILLHKGIADSSQTLYFDTASNWRKFTRVPDRRSIFSLASWMSFKNELIDNEEPEETSTYTEDDFGSTPFIYAKACINLIRGSELNTIKKIAPTEFLSPLLSYYAGQKTPITDIRAILKNELDIYKQEIIFEIERTPNLKQSALYLFLVFLSREYQVDAENFNGVVNELGLKFDFADKFDVINHLLLCSGYINRLKISTGEYDADSLNYAQYDIATSQSDPEALLEKQLEEVGMISTENEITQLRQNRLSYSIKGLSSFYLMDPAIDDQEICSKIILKLWRELLQCFYMGELNQQVSDLLRSKANALLLKYMSKNSANLLSFSNLQLQHKAFEQIAYTIFIQCHERDESDSHDDEVIGHELFLNLTPPPFTQDQMTTRNLLNTRAKEGYEFSILEGYKNELIKFLNSMVGKLAHPNLSDQHGPRLSELDHGTLKQMTIRWYVDNYVKSYLELNQNYAYIFEKMTADINRFTTDPIAETAILSEVRNFVRSRFNPYQILDFTSNY